MQNNHNRQKILQRKKKSKIKLLNYEDKKFKNMIKSKKVLPKN